MRVCGLEEVGVVLSPTSVDEFSFLLLEGKRVAKGSYCAYLHPLAEVPVLCRVFDGSTVNPEMAPLGVGVALAKRGVKLGREQEVVVMKAESLGYLVEEGGVKVFKRPDFPPLTGGPVYAASEVEVKEFWRGGGLMVEVGRDPYSGVPVALDVDSMFKGHVAVYGQTRSGKTTFMLNLIAYASALGARFIVLDRYGEYGPPLKQLGALVLDASMFKSISDVDASSFVSSLGLDRRRKAGEVLAQAFEETRYELRRSERPLELLYSKAMSKVSRDQARIAAELKAALNRASSLIEELAKLPEEPPDVVELVKKHKVIVVDLSRERRVEWHQRIASSIIDYLASRAVATRGEEFAVSVVVEEAQFYAPEMAPGVPKYGDPEKSWSSLVSALSQLGGFNVGFFILTQRPAYVAKAVLSQCNTHVVFRLMAGADHDQVSSVTGYPRHRIASLVSGLRDHVGFLIGMASPFDFPVFLETKRSLHPAKASSPPSEVLKRMMSLEAS
ncbi:MAG: hypothetical protein DRJ97_03875 [Thermoprotei archaeon]|nr:MAG: hypothetical protein DRJ97_03875 [Thermoprotei archaeon]